MKSQN